MLIMGCEVVIPWGDMQVGDSVFIPALRDDRYLEPLQAEARAHNITVQTRWVVEDGCSGLRVWRV